jgi:hypothetical protein
LHEVTEHKRRQTEQNLVEKFLVYRLQDNQMKRERSNEIDKQAKIWVRCSEIVRHANQGCQMVCFQTKNPNLDKFCGSCNGRCWYILWTLGPFCSLLLYSVDIWYSSW